MDGTEPEERIEALIEEGFREGVYPSLVLKVQRGGREIYSYAGGLTRRDGGGQPVTADTLYDLASLTKPLATTVIALKIMEEENISPDRRCGDFLPGLAKGTGDITLAQLFTHSSGLPPVPEIFRLFPTPAEIDPALCRSHLFSLQPRVTPGTEIIYSCTGYILLKEILERISGMGLEALFNRIVAAPGNLDCLVFRPLENRRDSLPAATEYCPWRGRILQGEVHDENAHCFGGVGGNAGLFGSARCVMKLLGLFTSEGFLGDYKILGTKSVEYMTTCQTPALSPKRAFGFLTQDGNSFAGQGFSPRAFGHTGFTGTSVWVDPDRELEVVLLTNRVHLGRQTNAQKIIDFRRELHPLLLRL